MSYWASCFPSQCASSVETVAVGNGNYRLEETQTGAEKESGSTATIMLVHSDRLLLAHVGDSHVVGNNLQTSPSIFPFPLQSSAGSMSTRLWQPWSQECRLFFIHQLSCLASLALPNYVWPMLYEIKLSTVSFKRIAVHWNLLPDVLAIHQKESEYHCVFLALSQ
jgi:hypothetical protein